MQDVQQSLAPDAGKTMAAGRNCSSLEVHLDVVPVAEGIENFAMRLRIGGLQIAKRLIRKHHTPTKGVVGAVALDDRNIVSRIGPFHQQRQIQAGRPSSDADDTHHELPGISGLNILDIKYLWVKSCRAPARAFGVRRSLVS